MVVIILPVAVAPEDQALVILQTEVRVLLIQYLVHPIMGAAAAAVPDIQALGAMEVLVAVAAARSESIGTTSSNPGGLGLNNGSQGGGGALNSQADEPGGDAGANTGGGGGGGSHFNSNNYGGAGGSGIVVLRYQDAPLGVFTSSNTSVATVDAATGMVTGAAPGSATITYTITSGTCTTVQTAPITVNSYNRRDSNSS